MKKITSYQTKKLGDVLDYEQPTKYIVNSTDYSDSYETPVLTAGKTFIKGYTDDEEDIFPADELPVIIFDDFTTASQLVDFKFKVKSSAMKILHAKKSEADIKYLFYVMQTIKHNHVTHKRYWISEYSKIEIPLPSLEVQKKIVAKLEKLLAKISEAKKLRTEAREDADTLLSAELHKIFEEGKTKGWEEKELSDIATFINGDRGKNYPNKNYREKEGVPFINAGHITDHGLDMVKMDYISEDRFNLLRSGKVNKGDILFCLRGSLGKTTVIREIEKGVIASSLVIVRSTKSIDKEFLFRYFLSSLCDEYIDKYRSGAAQPNLSVKNLKKFIIPLPSLSEQKKIVARLDSISEKTKQLQEIQKTTHNELVALEQSILSKAFSGEFV
ncbi:MAG: restriction endonuclease subunit S [Candidatus Paceibacterota bacterium]